VDRLVEKSWVECCIHADPAQQGNNRQHETSPKPKWGSLYELQHLHVELSSLNSVKSSAPTPNSTVAGSFDLRVALQCATPAVRRLVTGFLDPLVS